MSGLGGRHVVVTAGGTREPIDPVRYIGNRSSGKMGAALAAAARDAGASVTLISTVALSVTPDTQLVMVDTADEMRDAVWEAMDTADVLFMAAAVADYRPRDVSRHKLKKSSAGTVLELVPTVDVLTDLRHHPRHGEVMVVGFAAETDDLEANAREKLKRKGLDLVVLNDIGAPGIGMGSDDNAVTVLDSRGIVARIGRRPKADVASELVEIVAARCAGVVSPPG